MSKQTLPAGTAAINAIKQTEYSNLTTFRKNHKPVITSVWCAQHVGIFYIIETEAHSGKVKTTACAIGKTFPTWYERVSLLNP